ncbi:hypothetical protein D3C72_1828320 [compost metagenome]
MIGALMRTCRTLRNGVAEVETTMIASGLAARSFAACVVTSVAAISNFSTCTKVTPYWRSSVFMLLHTTCP